MYTVFALLMVTSKTCKQFCKQWPNRVQTCFVRCLDPAVWRRSFCCNRHLSRWSRRLPQTKVNDDKIAEQALRLQDVMLYTCHGSIVLFLILLLSNSDVDGRLPKNVVTSVSDAAATLIKSKFPSISSLRLRLHQERSTKAVSSADVHFSAFM